MTSAATGSLYLGLMSGTSMDGVDAAVCSFGPRRCTLHASRAHPYPDTLRAALLAAAERPETLNVDDLGTLDHQVGAVFAEAASALIGEAGLRAADISAIGSHGQTVRHRPAADYPFTVQIGDPNRIAEATGITTVADFRRRDMALGGQGAPLAPAFHQWLLAGQPAAVVNIGGISNITIIGERETEALGFDTGPGNTLMDAWIRRHQAQAFDRDGSWAASGSVSDELLSPLRDDPHFSKSAPKSTGFEYFNLRWLDAQAGGRNLPAADVQATLAELTAASIADAVDTYAAQATAVYVCGGGVHNGYLMSRLGVRIPDRLIASTAEIGLHPDWVEAATFAWLAQRTLAGKPGNLPSVTGATAAAVLGAVYFGTS